jgi:hypothetical protein
LNLDPDWIQMHGKAGQKDYKKIRKSAEIVCLDEL